MANDSIHKKTIDYLSKKYSALKPCSSDEIIAIEDYFSVTLPNIYKEFLLMFGNGSSDYMVGDDYTFYWLKGMKAAANEMLRDSDLPELTNDSFVFWMHQGYQFMFFYTRDGNENPSVFYFNQCYKMPVIKISDTLSELLCDYAEVLSRIDLRKYDTKC